jgi:hypothetical protein
VAVDAQGAVAGVVDAHELSTAATAAKGTEVPDVDEPAAVGKPAVDTRGGEDR